MPNQTRTFFKLVNSLGGGKHKRNHSTDLSSFHTEASKLVCYSRSFFFEL